MSEYDFSFEGTLVHHFDVFSQMSHEAMLLFALDGRLLRANRASYELTGLAENMPLHEYAQHFTQQLYSLDGDPLPPDQLPHYRVAHGETLDAVKIEYNSTESRLLSCSGRLIGDKTQQAQAVLLVFRDITHEQQQEQIQFLTLAVAHHAAQFQALFSNIPDGVAFVDSINHIMYVNEAGQRILGRPPMEKLEANADYYGVRELDGTPMAAENLPLSRALRGEQVVELEHIIEGAKGKIIRVSASANPIHGEDNSIMGAIAIFRDVTEQREREDKHRQRLYELEGLRKLAQATGLINEEEAIYSTIVTQLAQVLQTEQCVVLTLDEQSEVFVARKPAYGIESDKLLHYDVTTHVIEQLFAHSENDYVCIIDQRDAKINVLSQTLLQTLDVVNIMLVRIESRGKVIGCVMVTNSKDDHYFDVSDMQLLQTVAPQIALAIINSRLYTQMQQSKQEAEAQAQRLAHVNAELDAFTYSVSHDLRAPLRAITGFSQLLERNLSDTSDRAQHQLSRIRVNVDKMSNLIDALLTFSRTGRQVPDQSRVDLHEVMQQTLHAYEPQINYCKALIQIDNLPLVIGDSRLLEIVFANLIGNAIKYRRSETQLHIAIRGTQESTTATVVVQDNGIGFDPRYQDKIFQVFQRLHTDDEYEGTGIGLSLVHKIVEAHRGRIWAEGQPGTGSTFYIELPLYSMPE
ncbi:MAG: ATP-binding protein [Chloroflexota bacterium]